MSQNTYIITIDSPQAFQKSVIDASQKNLIMVDFWAEWCQPCQILIPLLHQIVEQYHGNLILAKVNSDNNQALALQMGVKSLPTVMFFKDGKVVDSFVGVKSETEIKALIDNHVKSPVSEMINAALELSAKQQYQEALSHLQQLNQKFPQEFSIVIAIIKVYLQSGDYQHAEEVVQALSNEQKNSDELKPLLNELALLKNTADLPALDELEKQIQQQPDNIDLQLKKANLYIAEKNYGKAMAVLFAIIEQSADHRLTAKQQLLQVFEIAGSRDPNVRTWRSKLFGLLN